MGDSSSKDVGYRGIGLLRYKDEWRWGIVYKGCIDKGMGTYAPNCFLCH